jgi:hypothetical protein
VASATLRVVPLLHELPPQDLTVVVQHPLHHWSFAKVREMITALRSCETAADYVAFQYELLNNIYAVDRFRGCCRESERRIAQGKQPKPEAMDLAAGNDPTDTKTWRVAKLVCDQVGRHLRAVGDALAWRIFDYDRAKITVLSCNQHRGPIAPDRNDGLKREVQAFEAAWKDRGHFALLHDLTSCLRIWDLTEVTADGYVRHEIKPPGKAAVGRQKRRMQQALDALNQGSHLPGNLHSQLFRSGQSYATKAMILNDLAEKVMANGSYAMRLEGGDGRSLSGIYVPAIAARYRDPAAAQAKIDSAHRQALRRIGARSAAASITAKSGDKAARFPTLPPWAIYPLAADVCAGLICNQFIFHAHVTAERLIQVLESEGMRAQWLPQVWGTRDLGLREDLLQVNYRDRSLWINSAALNQLLLELVDLQSWACAVREMLADRRVSASPEVIFLDEAAAWS